MKVDMKWVSLFLLMTQATTVIFITRSARANAEKMYLLSSVTVYSEFIKLVISAVVFLAGNHFNVVQTCKDLHAMIVMRPVETLLVGVPAVLYTVQNNLIAVGMSNLPGAIFQVTNQLKILFTALLSTLILRKVISKNQWIALGFLFMGVVLIQLPTAAGTGVMETSPMFLPALLCVIIASVTSGFAGVWFEKVLKSSDVPMSVRNIQLAFIGWVLAIVCAYYIDGDSIRNHPDGMLQNYTGWAWGSVAGNAIGGLLVSLVIKYADNVLKCFASSVSIIITCLVSFCVLNEFQPDALFVSGTACVCLAVYLYGTNSSVLEMIMPRSVPKIEVDAAMKSA